MMPARYADAPPVERAMSLLRLHERRSRLGNAVAADEISWNILLALFIDSSRYRKVTVSRACALSGAPSTTALRHLRRLADSGHIIRTEDPSDARQTMVQLSDEARALVQQILEG
jgi:DNA-binding MarR family transcriptional regulator